MEESKNDIERLTYKIKQKKKKKFKKTGGNFRHFSKGNNGEVDEEIIIV